MRNRTAAALAAGIILCGALPARAQDAALDVLTRVEGEAMFARTGAVGMVLAVIRGPNAAVAGFGETAKGNGRTPDGRTIVRIGSISKAFAGEILGSLAADGTVRLTDPIRRHLPAGQVAPDFQGKPITLLDLATHTAGFPRDMPVAEEAGVTGNPYRHYYTPERYHAWLAKTTLPYAPGRVASYSNYGFGLLGDIMGRAAGTSFETLLAERITGPVGMADTTVALRDDQRTRFMTGYNADNTPAEPLDGSEVMQASGGIFSTADDMARWLRHNLAGTDATTLAQAVYRPRQGLDAVVALDGPRPMDGMGLGWEIGNATAHAPMLIQKTGGFSGFLSYAVFAPGRGLGAFVVVNRLDLPAFFTLMAKVDALMTALAPR